MRRGEIYCVDLGPPLGVEPGGLCPVVVVSADLHNMYPLVVVVVIGTDSSSVPIAAGVVVTATESGASADFLFFHNQIRTLDPSRFSTDPVGNVPAGKLTQLIARLKAYLDIP